MLALAAVGFVVARVGLRERHDLVALAQGMVIGPALWGIAVNFILYLIPGIAGALVGWVLVLSLGGVLVWRGRTTIAIPWRPLASFAVVALALFWVMLAARQLMKIPDPDIHLGLSAYIGAGGWPPATPWNPDVPIYYHHGLDLLIGLLAPPTGPGPVLVTELLGAYVWTSFALIVATAMHKRGGWRSALLLSPLLLTAGAWTLAGHANRVPNLLQIPVPTDLETIGLRDSLAGLYWPDVASRWHSELDGAPANIWKPPFVLAYALTIVVLWHSAAHQRRTIFGGLFLAALIGFLGLVSEELALLVAALWIVLELIRAAQSGRIGRPNTRSLLSAGTGPSAALVLLAVGGGGLTGALLGATQADIAIGWFENPLSREPLGRHELLQGRIGLLGVGAIPVAVSAVLLAWRDRLVLALAFGSLPLMAAALMIEYPVAPHDVTRFDGHARNFALLALLLSLSRCWSRGPVRWTPLASIALAALVVWPTIARPVRTIVLGLSRGVQLTDSADRAIASDSLPHTYDLRRFAVTSSVSETVASYLRSNSAVNARVFSAHPSELSIRTGRPNASGLDGQLHLRPFVGPEFDDVFRYLEPAAVRRRGFEYLHATDSWIETLPEHAQLWLHDSRLFHPVIRTDSDALFRILPAFLELNGSFASGSYEALRQFVPASAGVHLAPSLHSQHGLRLASALSHALLRGSVDPTRPHLLTDDIPVAPSTQESELLALPARMAPASLPDSFRRPIWWNHEVALYSPTGTYTPIRDPPPQDFSISLSEVRVADGRIAFTATFLDRATDRWSGQDWVVVATDNSPWRLPYRFGTATFTSVYVRWFDGQVVPVPETESHEYFFLYQFAPLTGTLALWDGSGYSDLSVPQEQLNAGQWMLAARPNVNREEVGLIPVLEFTLADDGTFTFRAFEGSLDAMLIR